VCGQRSQTKGWLPSDRVIEMKSSLSYSSGTANESFLMVGTPCCFRWGLNKENEVLMRLMVAYVLP